MALTPVNKFETENETNAIVEDNQNEVDTQEEVQEVQNEVETPKTKTATKTAIKEENMKEVKEVQTEQVEDKVVPTNEVAIVPEQNNAVQEVPTQGALKPLVPGALMPKSRAVTNPYVNFEWVLDQAAVEESSQGAYPKLTALSGGLDLSGDDVGKVVIGEIYSYNPRWMVVPGNDSEEAKKTIRNSYDNQTISGSDELLADYVKELKEGDYPGAEVRNYMDLWLIVESAPGADNEEDYIGQLIQVQLSPQTVGQFSRFCTMQGIAMGRGVEIDARVKVTGERRSNKRGNFGVMTFAKAD